MQIQNALLTGSTTVYGPITFVSGSIIGSASYAQTSSYADTFTVAGSLTAQTLVVQTITSSISYITGSTRFGSLLTNTHTFTGSVNITASVNVNNSKILIGDDGSYSGYATIGFGGNSNGFNRIIGGIGTADGLFLNAATTRGIYFRPGGKGTNDVNMLPNGNVGLGVNFILPTAQLHISGSGSGSLMQISSTVSSSIFFVSGSGNVGINTITPTKKLDVLGDIRLRVDATGLGPSLILNNGTEAANNYSQIAFGGTLNATNYLKGGIAYATVASGYGKGHMYFLQNSIDDGSNATLANAVMAITNTGSVGIGLINPSSKLHVSGSGSGSLMQISSTVSSSIFFVSGSGNIGIGTTTPSAKLEVNVGLNSLKISGRDTYVDSTEDPTNANIYVTQAGVGDFSQLAGNLVLQARTQGTVYRDIIFAGGLSNGDALMTILGEGNVGIAETSPSSRLSIGGVQGSTIGTNVALLVGNTGAAAAVGNMIQMGLHYNPAGATPASVIGAVFTSTAGFTKSDIFFATRDVTTDTAPTERMRITSAGSVGIGTTSPAYQLQVLNTIGLRANSVDFQAIKGTGFGYSPSSYKVVLLGSSASADFTTVSIGYDPAGNANGSFNGSGTEVLFRRGVQFVTPNSANNNYYLTNLVLYDGNVGIGTTTPGSKLHLYDGTNPLSLKIQRTSVPVYLSDVQIAGTTAGAVWSHNIENTSNGSVSWGSVNNVSYAASAIMLNSDTSNSYITFHTSGSPNTTPTERMRIKGDGGVSIVGPYVSMDGSGPASFSTPPSGIGYGIFPYSGVGLGLASVANGIGFFIGTTTERMRVTATATHPVADNAYTLGASGIRWSAVWAANGTIQTSDEREKKDIVDSDLGLEFVTKLRPVSFKWKIGQNIVTSEVIKDEEGNPILDENGKEKEESVVTPREGTRTHYGLIAQEVESLLNGKDFGGFIHDTETDIKGLRYDQFVPLLVKSIQELSTKLDEATTRIKTLESK